MVFLLFQARFCLGNKYAQVSLQIFVPFLECVFSKCAMRLFIWLVYYLLISFNIRCYSSCTHIDDVGDQRNA
jgi:hypothetical protein